MLALPQFEQATNIVSGAELAAAAGFAAAGDVGVVGFAIGFGVGIELWLEATAGGFPAAAGTSLIV